MAYPVFHVPAGDVLPVMFATYAGSTGASVTLTGLLASDIEIYKDGGVTQRASDAGYTLLDTDGIDFDGLTGIHGFSIDTGDNTDAGFYTVGSWFTVVVSAVTVDSQTVSFIACQFRLMAAESVAAKPKVDVDAWLGTAAATPSVAGVPEVDLTHVAGATTNVAALATNVDAILADTADMQPKLGTPAGASVSADVAAVKSDTAAILADTGTDGVVVAAGSKTGYSLSAAGIQAIWDALTSALTTVGSIGKLLVDNINATISSRLASASYTSPLDAAGTRAALGLAAADLDTQLDAIAAAIDVIDNFLDTEMAQVLAAVDTEIAELVAYAANQQIRTGTAQAGAAGSITLDAGASAVDDQYLNQIVVITSGTGAGQCRAITDYAGATKIATVNANWATAPNNTSTFVLLPLGISPAAAGLTAADVWGYSTRELTSGANISVSAGAGEIEVP